MRVKGGFDRRKTLQELEQHDWGEPTYDSHLVITCHRLRRKPLDQFTVEDLRIMIGQQISLSYLLPLAVEQLEAEPFAEGNYYPGDLLSAVVGVDEKSWASYPDSLRRVHKVLDQARSKLSSLDEVYQNTIRKLLDGLPRALLLRD